MGRNEAAFPPARSTWHGCRTDFYLYKYLLGSGRGIIRRRGNSEHCFETKINVVGDEIFDLNTRWLIVIKEHGDAAKVTLK